jgi:hypothetical protein
MAKIDKIDNKEKKMKKLKKKLLKVHIPRRKKQKKIY